MQIVIDIPEGILNTIQADEMISREQLAVLQMHILNGTPFPKGHGDLIDRSKIHKAIPAEEDNCTGMGTLEEMDAYNDGIDAMYSLVKGAHTIIEADRESDTE